MADGYITSSYIITFFKLTFLVLMYAFFPFVLISLAYVIYFHVMVLREVAMLMDKGYTLEEAERRIQLGKK